MASPKNGKLEAQITVPAGGWSVQATNSVGGPSTVTVPAGTYYPTDLCSTFATQLNASRPNGWTVTPSFGESGTGKVTIHCTNVNWSIQFTTLGVPVDLMYVLGFTADISGASSAQTGTNHAIGVWLPGCPMYHPTGYNTDHGQRRSDTRYTRSPNGYVKTLVGNRLVELKGVRWDYVAGRKARIGRETTTNESLEYFWRNCHTGAQSYITAGAYVRLHLDADSATAQEYKAVNWQDCPGKPAIDGYAELWRVELDLIKKPAGTD